jgi:hypothetical protein
MKEVSFRLGWALLLSHELDAVAQSEWRLLYILRGLPDAQAMAWFIALHVPLFALIFWLIGHAQPARREGAQLALAVFLVIHAGLHKRLESDPLYTFDSLLSNTLIYGAAACGIVYCTKFWLQRGGAVSR